MTRLTRLTRLNGAALVLVSSAVVSGLVGPSADAAALTCDGLTVTIRGTARAGRRPALRAGPGRRHPGRHP
ncbi:hypothetical protein GCM10009815_10860 [Nocardioides marmoribigeumensis]